MKVKKIVHIIDIQNFMDYLTYSKNSDMHGLKSIYGKVYNSLKAVAKEYFVFGENYHFYPSGYKLSDLAIVSLAISDENLRLVLRFTPLIRAVLLL